MAMRSPRSKLQSRASEAAYLYRALAWAMTGLLGGGAAGVARPGRGGGPPELAVLLPVDWAYEGGAGAVEAPAF